MTKEDIVEGIRSFASGRMPLEDFRDWLADHVQETDSSPDAEARSLADQGWIAIAEYDAGMRDEANARWALAELLRIASA